MEHSKLEREEVLLPVMKECVNQAVSNIKKELIKALALPFERFVEILEIICNHFGDMPLELLEILWEVYHEESNKEDKGGRDWKLLEKIASA